MSGYTPGPWKVWRHSANKNEVYIEGANKRSVCYVIHNDDERKEQDADSRLIATAPELLYMLEQIVALERSYDGVCWVVEKGFGGLIAQAEMIIARAEGKAE